METARLSGEITARFPSCVPPLASLEILVDKGRFYRLLQELGIPHPRTRMVNSGSLSEEAMRTLGEGWFIKPRISQEFFRAHGRKALWPFEEATAQSLEALRQQDVSCMLQEYVPGPPSNHFFLDGFVAPDGRVIARFARRRLRMYPTDFGNSSLMVSVPLEDLGPAPADLERLLGQLGYRGIFSAEFKRDDRDGTFRLVEVNPRAWWFVEFAARCGVDTATMSFKAARGDPLSQVRFYEVGRVFSHPYFDIRACKASFASWPRVLMEFLKPLPGASQPLFSWDDPYPALGRWSEQLLVFLRNRLRPQI
jgi:predicted ATP-grasp superfamily ATP-dependent carboligase